MILKFTKMHGLGNDFIMIDNLNGAITLSPEQVRFLCDRHFGIGADGVILMESKKDVDCFMNYINADGSLAEMCGNGIRCIAKFFKEKTSIEKKIINIGTRSGIKEITVEGDGTYSVVMGIASFENKDYPAPIVEAEGISFECISMGNPFAVSFVQNLENIDLPLVGPKVEHNPQFPNRINVEFVQTINNHHLKAIVWERGCGVTLACGTGACAVYALAKNKGLVEDKVQIELAGGNLILNQDKEGRIIMTGPAVSVFESEITI